jgi:hypothetical protein
MEYSLTQQNWFCHTNIPVTNFATYVEASDPNKILFTSTETNFPVCEFLNGSSDNGREISSRVDLNNLLLPSALENIASPSDIILETERGNSTHCFISLD